MPDSISDSEDAMLMMSQRRGLPLIANGGAETLREGRTGIPLRRVAYHIACGIRSLHELGVHAPGAHAPLMPSFQRMLHAYLGIYNMLGAARDMTLAQRLLRSTRADLETWLRVVALEGDVHGTASLETNRHPRSLR